MFELSPAEWTAVDLSLRIALVATAWALPFGIAIGWLLARGKFWGKTVLDGLVHLPLVLPPVVTGYLLLMWFGRKGPVGAFLYDHFGVVFAFRWTGAALASGVRSEEHTSELQSQFHLVCRLLLEKKKKKNIT